MPPWANPKNLRASNFLSLANPKYLKTCVSQVLEIKTNKKTANNTISKNARLS